MMPKVIVHKMADGAKFIEWWCPGCKQRHAIRVPGWTWNENEESPTFNPSVGVNLGRPNPEAHVCHTYVREGQIQFLTDCSHDLAGQTVPLPSIPEEFL